MPRSQDTIPSYAEVMTQLLNPVSGPIPVKEFAEQILAIRPSKAKNPLQAVRSKIREENGHLIIFLDAETILPVRLAMQGVRFRLQLEQNAIDTGLVDIGDRLPSYLPRRFSLEKIRFIDKDGLPIALQMKAVTEKVESFIGGTYDHTILYANLSDWLRKHNAHSKDYILFTVIDWQNGIFQLEHEQYAKRDAALLKYRNQQLADLFYEMLEISTQEELYKHEAVPTVYAHLPGKSDYPPDHWMTTLENDGRMSPTDWSIRYSDAGPTPFEGLVRELAGEPREIAVRPVSKAQGDQVYRFRAELKDRPKIWRDVELRGKQTLSDLTVTLVHAFGYDWDHMAEFWKLMPRKATRTGVIRYREVELGDVDPEGGGDGANVKIAGLELTESDKLKFVFDFGNWIEHTLTLETIESAQPGAKYPREVARNKPKYENCTECAGEKTVAKWTCLTCSNKRQEDVLLCKKCVEKHEEHYVAEILY